MHDLDRINVLSLIERNKDGNPVLDYDHVNICCNNVALEYTPENGRVVFGIDFYIGMCERSFNESFWGSVVMGNHNGLRKYIKKDYNDIKFIPRPSEYNKDHADRMMFAYAWGTVLPYFRLQYLLGKKFSTYRIAKMYDIPCEHCVALVNDFFRPIRDEMYRNRRYKGIRKMMFDA